MKISFRFCRLSLFLGAATFTMIALVIATVVIPPVKADTFFMARPEAAATGFWVSVVLHLLIATTLFFTTRRITESNSRRTGILVSLAIVGFLLALALVDAGDAFKAHGPALQTATTVMFICAAAGCLASLLLITIAFLLRKRALLKA